jgi:endonuclease YncB( thermonuclease family)
MNTINIKNIDSKIIQELRNSDNSIPFFSLNGLRTVGKIVDVYDGDTCTINILIPNIIKTKILGFTKTKTIYTIQKYKCRMNGYDSSEMKPLKTDPNRDIIKKKAVEDRNYFCNLVGFNDENLNQNTVDIECLEFDKYGRLLINIFNTDNKKINDLMIESNHGYVYTGGTKQKIDYNEK